MKRQRGRNRSGGNGGNSGGGKPQQNVNRAFDSNGPENVKIRGHAQHVFEKYQQLARDAFSSGDRVVAENYLQHADHYFRVLRMLQPQRPASEILGRDVFTSGLDIDFEEEGEGFEEAAAEANAQADAQAAEYGNGEGRDTGAEVRNGRDRPERNGQDRQDRSDRGNDRYEARPERSNDRYEGRNDRGEQRFEPRSDTRNDPRNTPRGEGEFRDGRRTESFEPRRDQRRFEPRRDDRPRDDRPREDRPREERPRDERVREDRPREERAPRNEGRDYGARDEAPGRDPLAVIEPDNAPLTTLAFSDIDTSPMLRSEDGSVSEAPAFLQAPATSEDSGETKRPRGRRRRPKTFDEAGGDGATPEVEDA
jgi:hypothetical protein